MTDPLDRRNQLSRQDRYAIVPPPAIPRALTQMADVVDRYLTRQQRRQWSIDALHRLDAMQRILEVQNG